MYPGPFLTVGYSLDQEKKREKESQLGTTGYLCTIGHLAKWPKLNIL
jgi:hypothetical protein